MWFMPLSMVVSWGLVIWAVVALAQGLSRPCGSNSASGQQDLALAILKRRYAKGEIDREEYKETKRGLA